MGAVLIQTGKLFLQTNLARALIRREDIMYILLSTQGNVGKRSDVNHSVL